MSLILVVDDLETVARQYAYDLERLGGYRCLTAGDGLEALDLIRTEPVDCILLDLEMPRMDGFEVLERLRAEQVETPVIVYTGTGNYDRCVRAVQAGASAFLDKSEAMERVVQEIENALRRHRLEGEVRSLSRNLGYDSPLIGTSGPMRRLREEIARLAPIPSPVLILGESGSGKELVARELHRRSSRSRGPFLPVNCAALPDSLVESELFGHEAGAFTGAGRLRKGAFESASRGTLFLDEIGELPAVAQAKLLRVLEDGQVARLGGSRLVSVDVRTVAATHRDLERDAEEGRFRSDLLFRLNVHTLRVPPLREHREDIEELSRFLLGQIASRLGIRIKEIAPETIIALAARDWTRNNVRELRNTLERMVLACPGDLIGPDLVPAEPGAAPVGAGAGSSPPQPAGSDGRDQEADMAGGPADEAGSAGGPSFREQREEAERRIVLAALERNGWQITRTAAALGLTDHSSLLKILRRLGIRRPD